MRALVDVMVVLWAWLCLGLVVGPVVGRWLRYRSGGE